MNHTFKFTVISFTRRETDLVVYKCGMRATLLKPKSGDNTIHNQPWQFIIVPHYEVNQPSYLVH